MREPMPSLAAIDATYAEQAALDALHAAASLPTVRTGDGFTIRSGFVPGTPGRVYHSVVELGARCDDVATLLADRMVERLGEWNAEFREGQVLSTLWDRPGDRAWLVRVRYATPAPMSDREYVYWLRRHDRGDDIVITYQSVDHPDPPAPRCVRATLSRTVHRCVSSGRGTRLEHLLSGDLGGALLPWLQNHALVGALATAQARDATNLRRLLQ